jgi:ferredoxin
MTLSIEVDAGRCMGSGNCSFYAPATFDLSDEGVAVVLDTPADPEDRIMVAARGCPTQAIAVIRDGRVVA